jgi:uncharacterized membrane protein (UPF0127 family)
VKSRRLLAASGVLAFATLASCASSDGSTSGPDDATTVLSAAPATAAPGTDGETDDTVGATGVLPEGFTTVRATITDPAGDECEVCLWLADAPDERGRGLMGVTDLGGAVGMAFLFEAPTSGAFYMFQTPTPLSIAWFGVDGAWVGSADMAPCTDQPADACPRYSPGAAYDLAIEVFADAGESDALAELGLADGSTVVLLDGTEALDCQTPDS